MRKADEFSLMLKKSQFPDFLLKEMSISAFLPTSRSFLSGWLVGAGCFFACVQGK